MNRFLPDTWWEALLRPFAMAAPDSHVYVEIMSPDFRFAFAIVLALLLLLLRPRTSAAGRSAFVLVGIVGVAFVPWLLTTGNGRYFVAFLLLAGPACVALVYALPWSRPARVLCALSLLAVQALAVRSVESWDAWSLVPWREAPYFQVAIPADVKAQPATFVTITNISYSLLYPQFNPASRWVNISGMVDDPAASLDTRRAQALFAGSRRIYAFVPTVPSEAGPDNLPTPTIMDVIDTHLRHQRLALDRTRACRMFPSRSAAQFTFGPGYATHPAQTLAATGFWLCPLRYPVAPPPPPHLNPQVEAVFAKLETQCPSIFPPGTAPTSDVTDGALRNYASADMKVYVMNDGSVYYKYWRALNPERIGSQQEILGASFHMECDHIRGRSGLPWQRSI